MATSTPQSLVLNDKEERIFQLLKGCFDEECRRVAKLLADKDDSNLLGQTEYDLRDQVHVLGAKALEIVANERQKKGWIRES